MNLRLDTTPRFLAVMEALTQYVDNASDLEPHELEGVSKGLPSRLKAAEEMLAQLTEVMQGLAG